ncbi:MAG: chromate transporter [Sphaerochaetaceae bacterium]
MKLLLQLFLAFFQIGLFSIGGGYAAMPFILQQAVQKYGWLTLDEYADLVTIAEITPGPIALNSASFVGMRTAGIWGMVIATLGNILPSVLIVLLLARLYEKYGQQQFMKSMLENMRPVVIACILSAGIGLLSIACGAVLTTVSLRTLFPVVIFLLAFILLDNKHLQVNPILLLCCGSVVGILYKLVF